MIYTLFNNNFVRLLELNWTKNRDLEKGENRALFRNGKIEFTSFIYRYPPNSANSRILYSNISFHGSPLPRFESVSADKISLAFLLCTRGPIESILQQIRVTKARESRCVTFSTIKWHTDR